MRAAPVAHGEPAGGSDPNNTAWFGVPGIAPGACHTGKRQYSPSRMGEVNGAPAGVSAQDELLCWTLGQEQDGR